MSTNAAGLPAPPAAASGASGGGALRPPGSADASAAAWYALAVLTLVTLFAYVDRGVLVLLAEPIRLRMGLSDLQLGLLQGTAVALFAAVASYPLGWLSDRFERRLVLAGCLLFWSLAVVACGLSQNFEQLLVASALVGAGEAGMVPIVYSLIPELFRNRKRQLANSIYALGSTAAGSLALVLCGQIIAGADALRPGLPYGLGAFEAWRVSFFLAALPAPLMIVLIATIRVARRISPSRSMARPADASPATPAAPVAPAPALLPYMRRHATTFLGFHLGVAFAIFAFTALNAWLAVIYMRQFGQTAAQVGAAMGGTALIATAVGFGLSVYGVRLFAGLGVRLNVRVLWLACLVTVGTDVLLLFATRASQMYAIQGVHVVLLTAASMLYPTALQGLAPSALRGRVVAVQSVVGLLFGAAAPSAVGALSDRMKDVPNGLLVAVVSVAVPAMLAAAALLWMCERGYAATVAAGEGVDAGGAQ